MIRAKSGEVRSVVHIQRIRIKWTYMYICKVSADRKGFTEDELRNFKSVLKNP